MRNAQGEFERRGGGLFGARAAARTAADAGDAARKGDSSELPALYQRLEDQIAQAITDLELQLTA